jgi:hypothetical protein
MKFRVEFGDAVDPVQRHVQLLRQGTQRLGRKVTVRVLNLPQVIENQIFSPPVAIVAFPARNKECASFPDRFINSDCKLSGPTTILLQFYCEVV